MRVESTENYQYHHAMLQVAVYLQACARLKLTFASKGFWQATRNCISSEMVIFRVQSEPGKRARLTCFWSE